MPVPVYTVYDPYRKYGTAEAILGVNSALDPACRWRGILLRKY